MRRAIAVFCLIVVATICVAQDKNASGQRPKPNLSGTWVLDLNKSSLGKRQKEGLTEYLLVIAHRDTEIKMVRRIKKGGREVVDDLIYYTDGRPGFLPVSGNIETKTTWRKNKLYRRSTSSINILSVLHQSVTEDEWRLSEDGATLVRTIHRSYLGPLLTSDRNEPSDEKYVFKRAA